jgi:thiamine biosynthesis protein ThiS
VNVVVNGRRRKVAEGATVADLIAELGLRVKNVVVERNGEPLERARFADAEIAPDDVLEIVRPVQGG